MFEHIYQPGFNKHLPEFMSCVEAFKAASKACGARDLVEDYLAADVWMLTSARHTKRAKFACLDRGNLPLFGLRKP